MCVLNDSASILRGVLSIRRVAARPPCTTVLVLLQGQPARMSSATLCSIKDRVALQIIRDAEDCGKLRPGGVVTEGTAGSAGVALALVCAAKGYQCHIYMPDDAAIEKSDEIAAFGASVTRVRPVSIAHPGMTVQQVVHEC
jgi:cysteine synthase